MLFGYSYKTSNAEWHEDEINAKDRESAYTALKAIGIRPIKVWEKERRSNKLYYVLIVLGIILFTFILALLFINTQTVDTIRNQRNNLIAEPSIRHFIPGTTNSTFDLNKIFTRPSERHLALYAIPGVEVRNTEHSQHLVTDFLDNLNNPVLINDDDPPEVIELKSVVAGMKSEFRQYIKIGGSIKEYLKMIELRQENEIAYRKKIISDYLNSIKHLPIEEIQPLKNNINELLRVMGMDEIKE